jgi:UDP-N-acetylglucosamine 2-epimerase (non-hydrolysing)
MNLKPIVVVVGTRAEAIKLIPVYCAIKSAGMNVVLCGTYQHADLLEDVFTIFDVKPDYNLGIMKAGQDLFHVTTSVLEKTKSVYKEVDPCLVIVHGDTTTTMSAALAAFYLHIPIAHVEAGLRTGDMYSPFPEEMNRRLVGQIATYHFAPTALATANLLSEGVPRENLFCTGNPVVDALFLIRKKIITGEIIPNPELQFKVDECKRNKQKIILLTAHRRESFDGGLERIFKAVKSFAQIHDDVFVFYPRHPNPNVTHAIESSGLKSTHNIMITDSIPYTDLVYLLTSANFVATDSGGIQEEAVSLGRHVLCLRDHTERQEGVWEGLERLVGTNEEKIIDGLEYFYKQSAAPRASSVYGDGRACLRIVSILKEKLSLYDVASKNKNISVKRLNGVHNFI